MSMKKALSMVLVLVTLISMVSVSAVSVSAASTSAYDILSTSKYAKVYTLSSSGRTTPYTSKYLSTRGSVTYGKSSTAYIDNKTDELYLCDVGVTNGKYWAYVSYPIGSKRAYAYIPLSAISGNNGSHAKTTSSGKFYCSYRKGYSTSSSYYVSKGETVYLLSTSGSQYQILYPISGCKWRIGWCSKSNYDTYCKKQTSTAKSTSTYKAQTTTTCATENNVSYKYVTMTVNTSSLNNWVSSMKQNESYVSSYCLNGVIVAAKVKSYKTVTWSVPKSTVYQGPGLTGSVKVKYTVPSVIQYKVHTHTRNTGFGKSWYYSDGCIKTIYTCNCGYRKEQMSWVIPLPDTSGSQTSKTVIQCLPQIN